MLSTALMSRFCRICSLCVLLVCAHARAADFLWFEQDQPKVAALQAVGILTHSDEDGLNPQDYDAEALSRAITVESTRFPVETFAWLDQWLTESMVRYLDDLYFGRIDPSNIGQNYSAPSRNGFEPFSYLLRALDAQRLPEAIREVRPQVSFYADLREALTRYRKLAADPDLQAPLPSLPWRRLDPGKSYSGLPALTHRLVALGDLPAGTRPPQRYEGSVIDGIRAFQFRHGLEADGVIGAQTFEQLNIPLTQRVRQIELTMERLRPMPLERDKRMIFINIPEFMLRAYEVDDGMISDRLTTKVVVGKAVETETPLFDEDMRFIEFSPYWNVPRSIARKELVPKFRRNPGYFYQQGFEFVAEDGRVLRNFSSTNLNAVLRGQLRIRQRPGPENALGDIKFIFPNNDDIYLHHTPGPQLFLRPRRDFSHGCIRVEAPVALAEFVLENEPDWNTERIIAAMSKGESNRMRLGTPVPVVIGYATVIVKNGGKIHFFQDLYGNDKLLDEALRRRSSDRRPLPADTTGAKSGND